MGDQPRIPVRRQANLLYPVNLNGYDLISGIIKVNDCFQSFGLLALLIIRFVLNGYLRQEPV
jgi:hypothetical protein